MQPKETKVVTQRNKLSTFLSIVRKLIHSEDHQRKKKENVFFVEW